MAKGKMATFTDSQRRISLSPWKKPMDIAGKSIGHLCSVVGNIITAGPTKTLNYQRTPRYVGSREFDEAQRLERQRRTSPERTRRLASMSLGNPENPTLMSGPTYPSARQKKSERMLYTQMFPQGIGGRIRALLGR